MSSTLYPPCTSVPDRNRFVSLDRRWSLRGWTLAIAAEPVEDATCHYGKLSKNANEAPSSFACCSAECIFNGASGLLACGIRRSHEAQPIEADESSRARIAGRKEPVPGNVYYEGMRARLGQQRMCCYRLICKATSCAMADAIMLKTIPWRETSGGRDAGMHRKGRAITREMARAIKEKGCVVC